MGGESRLKREEEMRIVVKKGFIGKDTISDVREN